MTAAVAKVLRMTNADDKEITRLRDLKTSAKDQLMIDPRLIQIEDGHNPRNYNLPDNRAHLDELKGSIREQGVLNPLMLRYDAGKKAGIVVDGECRLRAVLELIAEGTQIDAVPCIQVPGGNEAERLVIALTANTGKPLSKWECGIAFQKLERFGWTADKIAKKMGYTERFVKEAVELSDAPEEVKAMLSSRAVTPSLALDHIRRNGSKAVETLKAKVDEARLKAGTQPKKPGHGGKIQAIVTARKERKSPSADLEKLVKALLSDVTPAEWNDEHKHVTVSKKHMEALRYYFE